MIPSIYLVYFEPLFTVACCVWVVICCIGWHESGDELDRGLASLGFTIMFLIGLTIIFMLMFVSSLFGAGLGYLASLIF